MQSTGSITFRGAELVLPDPRIPGTTLLEVSAPVPVTMGEGGTVVLQVRRGTFAVELVGVLPRSPERLSPPRHPAPWPDDEVWVWNAAPAGSPSMGQVSLSGARAVDHARTHAPSEWQGGATFRLDPAGALVFEVIQRGVSETSTNRLVLRRDMRVDLAGTGYQLDFTASGLTGTTTGSFDVASSGGGGGSGGGDGGGDKGCSTSEIKSPIRNAGWLLLLAYVSIWALRRQKG